MPGASRSNANTFGKDTSLKILFLAPNQEDWEGWEDMEGCFSISHEQGRHKFKFLFCYFQGIKDETLTC